MLLGCNNMAMPALLNKLATENLVQEASRIIDCFATIMPYLRVGENHLPRLIWNLLQKHHPELGDNLKVDDLSGRLLPEAAAAIKPHDPLDTARWHKIACETLSHNFPLRRSFLILQSFCESNIVEKLLEKSTSMERALEVCSDALLLCQLLSTNNILHRWARGWLQRRWRRGRERRRGARGRTGAWPWLSRLFLLCDENGCHGHSHNARMGSRVVRPACLTMWYPIKFHCVMQVDPE